MAVNKRQRTQYILDLTRQFVQDSGRPLTIDKISHGIMRGVWPMATIEEVKAALSLLVACGELRVSAGDPIDAKFEMLP